MRLLWRRLTLPPYVQPLLAKTFRERRNLLQTALPPYEDFNDPTLARFGHVESLIGSVGDLAPVEAFFHRALSSKCEGIMVKILDHEVLTQSSQVAAEVKEEEAEGPVDANQLSMDVYAKPEVKAEEASASLLLSQSPSKSNKSGRRKGKMLLPASYEPDKSVLPPRSAVCKYCQDADHLSKRSEQTRRCLAQSQERLRRNGW